MRSFNFLVSTLCLSLATLPLTQAGPLATRATSPTPTRPFTVSAFESPLPLGQGITGLNLTARGGNLYLSPNPKSKAKTLCQHSMKTNRISVQKAVLFVSGDGRAYLVRSYAT